MSKYEQIVEALQNKVDNGELTLEDANRLNDLAYDKYVLEASDEKDLELIDELRSLVEAGKVKLSKDDVKCIKELIDSAEDDDSKEDDKSDNSDDTEEE